MNLLRFAAFRWIAVAALCSFPLGLAAQAAASASIQQKLESEYTLSKAAADNSDIVTAGAVLVLQKDGLMMSATSTGKAAANTYKDGKISQGMWKVTKMPGFGSLMSHSGTNTTVQTRTFVTGEKFWVTAIAVHNDGVVLNLLSDPFSDVRYYATLKFPFANKNALPPPDQVDTMIGEVIKVQPADSGDSGASGAAPSGASPAAAPAADAAPAPMAPIAPPPPPTDAPPPSPKTIALKQTRAQVIANFGQPTKVIKLGAKEIDEYPDMKVTYVNNKVTDVQ
jgi:hypothetical protein